MTSGSKKIEKIYSGITAKHYDLPISHFFGKYKKLAFNESSLKTGDKVLIFCCGTGLDFPHILKKIGKEGEIIIGDLQLASDWLARLNPITVFFAKRYGGSYEDHQNSIKLCTMMKNELTDVRKREFFLKSYFYCIGKTN